MALSGEKVRPSVSTARGLRTLRISLALACVLFSAPVAANEAAGPSPTELIEGLLSGRAPVGGPFELTDQTGHRRTDADFRGKLVVLYFGYTSCPDVCPTELQSISLALDGLGNAAGAVQPLFITVDPERDTAQLLSQYVPAFDKRFLGLTGTLPEIDKTAKDFHVYYQKVEGKTKDSYSMDHTAGLYIYDPEGRIRVFAGNTAPMDSIVHDLKILLGQPVEPPKV